MKSCLNVKKILRCGDNRPLGLRGDVGNLEV